VTWFAERPEVIEHCFGQKGELQLQRRGREFEIIYNGVFLMATYNGASEKAAVREALKQVAAVENGPYNVMLGGLGVGYSLQQALACKEVEQVVVAEIEPAVIRWCRTQLAGFNDQALDDRRVSLFEGDFRCLLEKEARNALKEKGNRYHLVLVDTDNGSSWLSLPSNDFFYSKRGLGLIANVLQPSGVAAFWCSCREEPFEIILENIFNSVSFQCVPEKTGQEGCIYLASWHNR
jgi:spermidine synthase